MADVGPEAATGDDLQFDRVVHATAPTATTAAVACASCRTPLTTEYYHVGDHATCDACRRTVEAMVSTPRGPVPLLLATVFGVGAGIAGAAVYYAVLAIAHAEIGIVAILIGYMVGWSVRKGAGGRGGRRFQVVAAILTYWSVGVAYLPLALGTDVPLSPRVLGLAAVLAFRLPVESVVRSLPGGLLSAAIIGFGILQAWRMTAAPRIAVSGPYRIGGGAPPLAT